MTHLAPVTHPVPVTSLAGDTYPSRAKSDRRDAQVPERPHSSLHKSGSPRDILRDSSDVESHQEIDSIADQADFISCEIE